MDLYELIVNEYHRVLPLMDNIPYDILLAEMVVENTHGGKIMVDNVINPTVALIAHHCGMSLLCGNEQNEVFNGELIKLLLKSSSWGPQQIRLMFYPEAWQPKLQFLLGERFIEPSEIQWEKDSSQSERLAQIELLAQDHVIGWKRVKFEFNRPKFESLDWRSKIPDGLTIQPIDEPILSQFHGSVIPQYYWDSPANFLKRGVGFCLLDGAKIIGVSFSAFITHGMIDIGIETAAEYRGQGMGVFSGAAMVEYCLENSFTPVWGCRSDNIASYRLAQKLGFEESFRHPVYWAVKYR